MNPKVGIRSGIIRCDVGETLDQLLALATALDGMGARLVLRLHPGMNREAEARRFANHGIAQVAELDSDTSLVSSMSRSDVVMSFVSTVLWEGGLLGLTPVQVLCACCDEVELGYEREILDLHRDLSSQLASLLARTQAPVQQDWRSTQAAEWATVREALLT